MLHTWFHAQLAKIILNGIYCILLSLDEQNHKPAYWCSCPSSLIQVLIYLVHTVAKSFYKIAFVFFLFTVDFNTWFLNHLQNGKFCKKSRQIFCAKKVQRLKPHSACIFYKKDCYVLWCLWYLFLFFHRQKCFVLPWSSKANTNFLVWGI